LKPAHTDLRFANNGRDGAMYVVGAGLKPAPTDLRFANNGRGGTMYVVGAGFKPAQILAFDNFHKNPPQIFDILSIFSLDKYFHIFYHGSENSKGAVGNPAHGGFSFFKIIK
jgi:hypothetical protein